MRELVVRGSRRSVDERGVIHGSRRRIVKTRREPTKKRPVFQLSKDELRVLRYAEEDMVEAEGHIVKNALGEWAADTWRQYLQAGCSPQSVVQRLPQLIRLLEDELASLRDGFREQAEDPDELESATEIARTVAEDLALAQAAETLLERLRQQAWQHPLRGKD